MADWYDTEQKKLEEDREKKRIELLGDYGGNSPDNIINKKIVDGDFDNKVKTIELKLKIAAIDMPKKNSEYSEIGTYIGTNPKTPEERMDYLFMHTPYGNSYNPTGLEEQQLNNYIEKGVKFRPPKPTQKDYNKIIQAQLDDLHERLMEAKIAIDHHHKIVWRGAKLELGERCGEKESEWYA